MYNIIKRGRVVDKVYKFKCDKCGTIFECTNEEFSIEALGSYVGLQCPICGNTIVRNIEDIPTREIDLDKLKGGNGNA